MAQDFFSEYKPKGFFEDIEKGNIEIGDALGSIAEPIAQHTAYTPDGAWVPPTAGQYGGAALQGAATGAATGGTIGAFFGGVGAIPGAFIGASLGAFQGLWSTHTQASKAQRQWYAQEQARRQVWQAQKEAAEFQANQNYMQSLRRTGLQTSASAQFRLSRLSRYREKIGSARGEGRLNLRKRALMAQEQFAASTRNIKSSKYQKQKESMRSQSESLVSRYEKAYLALNRRFDKINVDLTNQLKFGALLRLKSRVGKGRYTDYSRSNVDSSLMRVAGIGKLSKEAIDAKIDNYKWAMLRMSEIPQVQG